MHVKLEVETQPLSNLWAKLKRAAKITLFFAVLIFVSAASSIWMYSWGTNAAITHHRDPSQIQILSVFLGIALFVTGVANFLQVKWAAEQKARWHSN